MYLTFYNPPTVILASGTKKGVELGGSKCLLSIDSVHDIYTEGTILTEISWAEFYTEQGLEDQIDTFTTKEYDSIRDDPEALVKTIVKSMHNIMDNNRLFYGIADFEVDAFMNQNTVIPGLKLDTSLINKLMKSHKEYRDKDLFPKLIQTKEEGNIIKITFQGEKKENLLYYGKNLEDIADRLRMAKGFATGIICTSKNAANFFIMNDRIVFREDEIPRFYIDQDGITIIELGIQRELLFPISWFRIDIGVRSLETLELWKDIKDYQELKDILNEYDDYIIQLVINKYKIYVEESDTIETDILKLSRKARKKTIRALTDTLKFLDINHSKAKKKK